MSRKGNGSKPKGKRGKKHRAKDLRKPGAPDNPEQAVIYWWERIKALRIKVNAREATEQDRNQLTEAERQHAVALSRINAG